MPDAGGMAMRNFGGSGVSVSAVGCGGHHLGDPEDQKTAMEIVHELLDGGFTFFDNCWE